MIKRAAAFLFFIFLCNTTFATHNRAGYIRYTWLGGYTYRVTVITYTKESSYAADRDSLQIDWGDGSPGAPNLDTIPRTNGPGNKGESIGNDIKYNEYTAVHTYPGFGTYYLSMSDPNRIASICNINSGNSVNERFYIEDKLIIPDPQFSLKYNNSPVIFNHPIDFANANEVFEYFPNAWDPDGDSLTFELITPKTSHTTDVTNYTSPEKVCPSGPNSFTINRNTGEIRWDAPGCCCIFNIAIRMTEWRKVTGSKPVSVGTTILDLEIISLCNPNHPPVISQTRDTCIVAGTTLKLNVTATDPDPGQTVTLTANGEPFSASPPDTASFTSTSGFVAKGQFVWNTVCNHINAQPYQVVFRAVDSYPISPLTDLQNWFIKVVAPAPQNLTANASGNSIVLKWDNPYTCSSFNKFIGFSIWRREGSNPFVIDTCVTGLAGKGYTQIADNHREYIYTDNNVDRGKEYCYRILAFFGDVNNFGQKINMIESLPSNEACAMLKKDVPVITNVSVRNTDETKGAFDVSWSKPDAEELDTIQNQGPYTYKIYRSEGFTGSSPVLIKTISAPLFSQFNDTTYIDSLVSPINTVKNPYSYKIEFYCANELKIGETETASSIFLTIGVAAHELSLSWKETVPWANDSFIVFRQNLLTDKWDSITTVTTHSYTDKGLDIDSTYCYYVKSKGQYSAPGFVEPIINLSQRVCAVPKDIEGPCAPTLSVINDCTDGNFSLGANVNLLKWNKPAIVCGGDAVKYKIYYTSSNEQPLQLIDSSHSRNDTSFVHYLMGTVAGCYAVSAIDSFHNEGPKSALICTDNCPEYQLPNVFTPNNDGKNDIYHPIPPMKYIDHVDMKIFDNWGVLVYETSEPEINWDGVYQGKPLPEGTYYYICQVYESRKEGVVKMDKPLSGFIHLYR